MPTRDERREAAAKNLALMRGAFASETKATVEAARVYENGEGRELPVAEGEGETATSVTTDFAPKAVFGAQGKVVVVDPCSFTRPGGAYEDGSFGPEQILCAESNLYPALCACKDLYHSKNRGYSSGMLFTDRALYLPDVAFVRDGTIRRADVLAIPEPIRARALENHRSERECEHALASRIESLLLIAAESGCETLVVGAFGCGPQGFAPELPISLFKAWIEAHPGAIGRIVFAVPRASFAAFDAAFGEKKEPEPSATPAPEGDSEEDEFDFDPADLPEGVTLRA